jgi:septal ring factor EnvC (AmiA/AmiB activator)
MRATQAHPLLLLTVLTLATPAFADDALTATRSTLEKWVETRQLISQTRADWQTDKETLEQTVALYERELQSIDEQLSKVATNNTQVAKEMAEAEALKKSSTEAIERSRQFAAEFEGKLKRLVPQLPSPLQDIVKKDMARMPADPANTKMLAAERVQACVGVLNEVDKFNSAVNLFSEKRQNARGEEVAVETVYVGLGAAYFVNEAGDFAGTGTPGANGWEWTARPEIAPAVRNVIKVYRSEHAPMFVKLPAAIR